MAPISPRFEISEIEFFLQAELNSAQGARDLARNECFPSAWRLVIEENSVTDEEVVSLPLINGVPMSGQFAHSIRAARVERRCFILRRRRGPEHFRRSCLVKSGLSPGFTCIVAKCFQQAQGACRYYVRSILSLIETHAHVRLRTQVVNFIGLDLREQTIEVGCISQVAVMQMQSCPFLMRIRIDVIETIRIERRCA